ncbi:dolichol kinase [Rhodnius prolixus]|uniref:dolichol kinase n=1 Tax=Rhodnius prolixus TaxID=13249 RepID=UPI003D18CF03
MAYAFMLTVNKHIQTVLNENNVDIRRDAGPGVWVSSLLPVAIIVGQIKYSTTSYKYKAAASISCGLLLQCTVLLLRMFYLQPLKGRDIIASCIVTYLFLYYFTLEGILISAVYACLSMFTYQKITLPLMKLCPSSFTYGEATLVCQSFILFLVTSLVRNEQNSQTCMDTGTIIIQLGVLCLMGLVTLSYYFDLKKKPVEFYCLVGLAGIFIVFFLQFLIGMNPLFWIFHLISENALTIKLMVFWILCTAGAVAALLTQIRNDKKATTAVRKIFHLLALLVFVPGIICKPCLLYVASGFAFALFIFLDTLRILEIPPISTFLQNGFMKFADEKDEGPVALTPVYLLVGCALPLWLYPVTNISESDILPLISGLLTVGVGDSAASICGSLVGKNKWPGSKKTKEGTAACFLSQLFLVIALIQFGFISRTNLLRPTFAIAICSLVEAMTDQVDNIVLPLLMYIMVL